MKSSIKISVILPVYNGEEFLTKAIESVLAQTYSDFEFIIVNDGSTDNSEKLIKSFSDKRIILLQQENKGAAYARNYAINNSKGTYLALMDCDDLSKPDRLERQINFIYDHTDCIAVGTNVDYLTMSGEYLYTTNIPLFWEEIKLRLPEVATNHASLLIKKEIVIKVGGYSENTNNYFEDGILVNKIVTYGKLMNMRDSLYQVRLSPYSLTNNLNNKEKKKIFKIVKNSVLQNNFTKNDEIIIKNILKNKTKQWKLGNYYLKIGKIYIENNYNIKYSRKNLLLSLIYNPTCLLTWFNLVLTYMPKNIIQKWKNRRIKHYK